VTARKRQKAQMSRRRRDVYDLLDIAYIRGSKAREEKKVGEERRCIYGPLEVRSRGKVC
jgi:hypothetical protein